MCPFHIFYYVYHPYDFIFLFSIRVYLLFYCNVLRYFLLFLLYCIVSDCNLFNRNNCQLIQPGHHSARLDLACRMFESMFEVLTECLTDCLPCVFAGLSGHAPSMFLL